MTTRIHAHIHATRIHTGHPKTNTHAHKTHADTHDTHTHRLSGAVVRVMLELKQASRVCVCFSFSPDGSPLVQPY